MDIRLPALGEGADSGSVVSILVKVGDQVKKEQTLIELENEKAVAAIPSTAAGTVTKIHVKVGDKMSVGQVLVTLSGGAKTGSASVGESAPPAPKSDTPTPAEDAGTLEEPVTPGRTPVASPSVRKTARELGIDLHLVKGSERGGRIVLADVKAYVQRLRTRAAQKSTPPAERLPSRQPRSAGTEGFRPERIDFSKWGPVTSEPMSSTRRTIAKRMAASWSTVPHVTQFDDADITRLLELKKAHDAEIARRGARLTLTAFVLQAVAATLKTHPKFNASLDEAAQRIVYKQYYHLGVAVDTDAGLVVPVIRDVDKKTLLELSKELQAVVERTRQRTVAPEELQGGTFTISNQGGIGGAHFTPIIKSPEVAILGVGRGRLTPIVKDGAVVPRMMLPLALSYDHRVIDGANAARFIRDLIQALEQFEG